MPVGRKYDFPPLLAPGRHYVTLMDVWHRFGSLGQSARRRDLFRKFDEFVQVYVVAEIPCEIWIDGSFLTEKPDPGDIDMSVIVESDVINALTDSQMGIIEKTNTGIDHPDLEVYVLTSLRYGDKNYRSNFLNPSRLTSEVYGLENSERWLKGFAILRLRETNVGLRIRS